MASMRVNVVRFLVFAFMAAGLALWSTPAFADAAATYKAKCAMCHGADGKGETPAGKKMGTHDFHTPEVAKQSDVELSAVIAKGKNKMPAYEKSLKADEIKDLVTYIRQIK